MRLTCRHRIVVLSCLLAAGSVVSAKPAANATFVDIQAGTDIQADAQCGGMATDGFSERSEESTSTGNNVVVTGATCDPYAHRRDGQAGSCQHPCLAGQSAQVGSSSNTTGKTSITGRRMLCLCDSPARGYPAGGGGNH